MKKTTLLLRAQSSRPSVPFLHSGVLGLGSAALLLAFLGGPAAQAQVTQLTAPPPGASATTTAMYPVGDADGFINAPFTVAAGNTNVTYTATNTTPGSPSFESFSNYDSSLDFPANTQIVDTFDGNNPTGPLLINFSSGVPSFGIKAEDNAFDDETFTFTVFSGTAGTTFVLPTVDNTQGAGKSVFLGAQAAGGQLITSILISSASIVPGTGYTGGSNDFYVGPLSIYNTAPVPEASTTLSFGLLLALGAGGLLLRRKKEQAGAA